MLITIDVAQIQPSFVQKKKNYKKNKEPLTKPRKQLWFSFSWLLKKKKEKKNKNKLRVST
jgi:hypothetical protein